MSLGKIISFTLQLLNLVCIPINNESVQTSSFFTSEIRRNTKINFNADRKKKEVDSLVQNKESNFLR